MRKSTNKFSPGVSYSKGSKKYVPTLEESNLILNYFLHNNFQDFNTWQQISRSKCEFQYNEAKPKCFECKVTLKWDDTSLPVIVGDGVSQNKRNAKKKALHKLIQNLIYLGLISYGFKEFDFIKKLPKRRKESSEEQSQVQGETDDPMMVSNVFNNEFEKMVPLITQKNFSRIMCDVIRERNLWGFGRILRKLQKYEGSQEIDTSFRAEDLEEKQQQNYLKIKLKNPFQEDLADTLKSYQLQLPQSSQNNEYLAKERLIKMELPYHSLSGSEGKISFDFFHPIEYTFIFRRNEEKHNRGENDKRKQDIFLKFVQELPIPKFEEEGMGQPMSYRVIAKILNIILEFAYDYALVVNLMSIFQREVTDCELQTVTGGENKKYYLRHAVLSTVQFAYLLNKKLGNMGLSMEGLINIESNNILTFIPKQPEEFILQKISKKLINYEIYECSEFSNEQFVYLVSKLDSNIRCIGQIIQCWPSMKIRCSSFRGVQNDNEKLPFTMYKLANGKFYSRIIKAVSHIAKSRMQVLQQNTFLITQKPTQPLLLLLCEILSEWLALNETVLIVSNSYNEINGYLNEKGFKTAKITERTDQKNLSKKSVVCCSPMGACADVIKNFAFTRVIIEGAHRVSETISSLAIDKGCKKLYLIGDGQLPEGMGLSKFGNNRKMGRSLYQMGCQQNKIQYNFAENSQQHFFQISILKMLNNFFYEGQLRKDFGFESPSIKGFPWPSEIQRVCFIHIGSNQQQRKTMQKKIKLCCQIVCSVIKSGFIAVGEIACRVAAPETKSILTQTLYNTFKVKYLLKQEYTEMGIKPELAQKLVDMVTGSRFQQKSLCIFVGAGCLLSLKHVAAALQEGKRGAIIISDLQNRAVVEQAKLVQILRWAKQKKLVLSKQDD